jgi:murein DD-endopeptidase MepM/ murein hydrolase activator NlpD
MRSLLKLSIVAAGIALCVPVTAEECLQVPVTCQVTSAFGPRFDPVKKDYSTQAHRGVDFGCPAGTPVKSASAGIVKISGFSTSAGNWVVVAANGGRETFKYMHHMSNSISMTSVVSPGQQVGFSGNTGARTTGPHLHFQMELGGAAVDPFSRFCSTPPLRPGVLQGNTTTGPGDTDDSARQTSAPSADGPAPKMGLEGGLHEIMADIIGSRAMNPDYGAQLAALPEPRLYAELSYLKSIGLKVQEQRNVQKERILATQAMIQVLLADGVLRPQLEAQREIATKADTKSAK